MQNEYPAPSGSASDVPPLQLAAAGTDGIFVCTARRAERSLAQYVTVWAYEFNDETAPLPSSAFSLANLGFAMGAYHSADVQYVLNRVPPSQFPLNTTQQQLSAAMISYWTKFAKTGNPNSKAQPHWRPYVSTIDDRQSFVGSTPAVESGSDFDSLHMCTTYWDGLVAP